MVFKIYKTGTPSARCGEKNPASADAVGVNITFYKYIHIMLGSGIMGIGGLLMCINLSGSFEGSKLLDQRIWMDLHCTCHFCELEYVICNIGDIYLRSFQYAAGIRRFSLRYVPLCTGMAEKNPAQFMQALPFLITAAVLVISSVRKKKIRPACCNGSQLLPRGQVNGFEKFI